MRKVDVFIFDCDGVIWKGDSLIDGVPAILEMLRKAGKRILLSLDSHYTTISIRGPP